MLNGSPADRVSGRTRDGESKSYRMGERSLSNGLSHRAALSVACRSDSAVSFEEDYQRVVRGFRIASRHDATVHSGGRLASDRFSQPATRSGNSRSGNVTPERVFAAFSSGVTPEPLCGLLELARNQAHRRIGGPRPD